MESSNLSIHGDFILHCLSASCHAVVLLVLSLVSVCHRFEERLGIRRPCLYRATLFTCLSLGLFYLLFFIFGYFEYWPDDKISAKVDLGIRSVSWLAIALYVRFSPEKRCTNFKKIWWIVFLPVSVSFLVRDIASYIQVETMEIHWWVLDIGSVVAGLVLGYAGVFGMMGREGGPDDLREPLLNGSSSSPSHFSDANFFSLLTFSWMNHVLSVGHKKTLDLKDVPELAPGDSAKRIFPVFKDKLELYIRKDGGEGDTYGVTTLNLAKAIFSLIRVELLLTALLAIINMAASYATPILVNLFIQYLNGSRHFPNEGRLLVLAFIVSSLLKRVTQRHWTFRLQQAGLRIRASLVGMIYQKGLTLSSSSRQGHTTGEIINIMSVDAERVGDFVWSVHDVWVLPVGIMLALLILFYTVGLASLAALAATFIAAMANFPFGSRVDSFIKKLMECKDERMKASSEILSNMRVLKLQAWETKFLTKITELREKEENWLRKLLFTIGMLNVVTLGAPTFVTAVTFMVCIFMGIPLVFADILSAITTFKVLQQPIYALPALVSNAIEAKVSLDRIASFLCLKGLQEDAVEKLPRGSSEVAIEVINGTFSWDLSSEAPTLRDLNFRILRGMRVAVCGSVGSGKSSLISSILGEIPKVSGTAKLCGTVAYVAQTPWIQSGKIQDNILFGVAMDWEKYESVLEACTLKEDLSKLPFGDKTVIGERGINLSGGQKQRLQIARALYHDADIFIFDDPFSAVDTHTGCHLFKECLLRTLASRTVVYVTHQVEFLPAADLIMVMKEGKITQAGKYNDILNSGVDFMELVGSHKEALAEFPPLELSTKRSIVEDDSCGLEIREHGKSGDKNDTHNGKNDETITDKGQLVQDEEREKGIVGLWLYWRYITMLYKGALMPLILMASILTPVLEYAGNYWMAWAVPKSKGAEAQVSGLTFIYVFLALAFASSLCVFVRCSLTAIVGFKTGTILFNKMHTCIFRAPMSFFDSTPSGRMLKRASSDQTEVDINIPIMFSSAAFSVFWLLVSIAVMSQVSWLVLVVFVPVTSACIWYQQYYIVTARELARLIGVCEAPNIQHFSESLLGSMTIRSFNQESRFVDTNFDLMDVYSRPRFHNAAAMEWLGFRLDMFSFIAFSFCLILLISLPEGIISQAVAGLAVTYGLDLSGLQALVIWNLCSLESKIISVERILQYMGIPSEPPLTIEETKPDSNWPTKGEVALRDLQVRYTPEMPLVLKGLTCSFPGGKKTGIVGRTGCGKTTLIQALFRTVDPTAGQISIDGIDISTLGLHDLRSKLSIIPQDPTMFTGTVRSNLDPLEEYTDEQIWEALDCCQLGDEIRKKSLKLDSEVTENGENWSVGQRQLVCLGRVILKRTRILVLDEATASVDTATDSLIQKTLRQQFSDSTVITIAHRITSILDSDTVLLLDNGRIAENDTPERLLENKTSLFSKLVSEYAMRSKSSLENLTKVKVN